MATGSAQKKRVKTVAQKSTRRVFELEGLINDDDAQSKYLDCWKMRSLVPHKYLRLKFFKDEGFEFQRWLRHQGLKKFLEMADPWYPDLVKVFYCNLKIVDDTLCSRVKGVDIKLTDDVWTKLAGLKLGGEKCHLGIEGFHKFTEYQNSLRNPEESNDYTN